MEILLLKKILKIIAKRWKYLFISAKNLILNVSTENNYTNLTSGDKNVWFGDAK